MKQAYEKPIIKKLQTGLMNKYGRSPAYARKVRTEIDGASIEALVNQRVPLPPGSEFDYIDRNRPRSGGPAHRDVDFDREAHPRGRKAHKAKPAMPHSAPIARMYLFGTEAAELYSALLAAGLVEQARDVHQPALGAA